MARTLTSIYDALALEKSAQAQLTDLQPDIDTAQTLLDDLNTPSRVARWRLMLWVVATGIWALEKLWDAFYLEVEALAASSHVGTLRWYVDQALKFQYGYALSLNSEGAWVYAVDDAASRIVVRAAAIENGSTVLLKVAKLSSGSLVALSGPEKNAFIAYIDDIKMAGTVVNVLTDGPDYLKVVMDVYYDPLVLNPNGSLILDGAVFPVRDAITAHVANLSFNGALVLTNLVDAAQAAEGVVNPVLISAGARYGFFALSAIDVQYVAYAGHMAIDPGFPLSGTLNYIPASV